MHRWIPAPTSPARPITVAGVNWPRPKEIIDVRESNEDLLQAYVKAVTAAGKVKDVKEWPAGIDGESIQQATGQFAEFLQAEVLRRMQTSVARTRVGRKPKVEVAG